MRVLSLLLLLVSQMAKAASLGAPGKLPWTTMAVRSNQAVGPGYADPNDCDGVIIINPYESPATKATWLAEPTLAAMGAADCALISASCAGNVCTPVVAK